MRVLALLIGGNNIANYALIEYFKNSDKFSFDKVLLIYTNQSKDSVKNIISLQNGVEFLECNLEDDGRNLLRIQQKISNLLSNIDISFIHLNYTGGTKPMSVGAFLAIDSLECEKRFSDISPDSSKLTFANGEIYPNDSSIDKDVALDIKSLYKLHGIELIKYQKSVSEFYSDEFVKYLIEKSIKHKNYESFWEVWDSRDIKTFDYKATIKDAPIHFDIDSINLKYLQNFIRGRWLEEYVFDTLKDEKFTDIAWNVEGRIKNRDFELDLVITKGHKSYIISCTTSTTLKDVKQKAFEASIRAEQIGGIRAKPISIYLLGAENLEKIQYDVKNYVGKTNFEFIGRDIVKNKDKFKNMLKSIF